MRAIDGDALIEVINRHCYPVQHDMTSIEPGMTRIGILQAIQEQPTVEPERKKGNWSFIGYNMFECTCCGTPYTTQQLNGLRNYNTNPYAPKYCPNCGADMRGENDD